ncbi:MAG TPA: membrane dipeptidase [Chthoniobacterales bacterium]|nr:membrane dipeptidase [Chthoniobacterales bacterium]
MENTTRRQIVKRLSALAAGTIVAPMINRGWFEVFAQSATKYSARAIDLLQRSTVLDMLNPFTMIGMLAPLKGDKRPTWLTHPETFTASDLQRFKDSRIDVMYIGDSTVGPNAYDQAVRLMGVWNGFIAHHGEHLMRVDEPERIDGAKKAGKIGLILGLQNAEHFRTVDDIDYFYELGQRISLLTYNSRNMIGNGSTERRDDGISDYGVRVVERMNKVGMAVDVAHCGDKTTLDAFEISKPPVLITHSNCRALNPHPRCKTDEAIRKMAAKGGVMGITGVRMFVSAKEPTTIEQLLDHYDHVAKLVGVEHVGVGSDYDLDGYDALPPDYTEWLRAQYKASYAFRDKTDTDGFNHYKRMFDLTDGLIRRGYDDASIELILGGNFRRVLGTIWTAKS